MLGMDSAMLGSGFSMNSPSCNCHQLGQGLVVACFLATSMAIPMSPNTHKRLGSTHLAVQLAIDLVPSLNRRQCLLPQQRGDIRRTRQRLAAARCYFVSVNVGG